MIVDTKLSVDVVAVESEDRISLMVDLTAPLSDKSKNRPSQAVQIVLDRSGSMSGQPLNSALNSVRKLIDRLAPHDSFGMVAFDTEALIVVPHRSMADHNLAALKQVIAMIVPGGSTDISVGYLMGLREIQEGNLSSGATLLLISDGHANAGETDPELFQSIAQQHSLKKITTSTIGLSEGYDETILSAIAAGGGGAHRFAATLDESVAAIAAEVDNLLDKTAINAVLKVTPVDNSGVTARVELLQQLPHWVDAGSLVVQLGDFYAGENRRFMIDFHVPHMASLGLMKIADVQLKYLNLADLTEMIVSTPITVNVVPDDIAKGRVENPVVNAERLVLQAQSDKSLANEELRSGKEKDAAVRLRAAAINLRREVQKIDSTDKQIVESVKIITDEADEMDRLAGYAESERVEFSVKRNMESLMMNSRSRKLKEEFNPK